MSKITIVRGSRQWQIVVATIWGVVAIGLIALPLYLADNSTFVFTRAIVFAVAVLGLNLLTGYAGQMSIGHNFFFAIGAYTSAALIADYDWHYLLTLPVGFVLAFVAGFVFSLPALRLKGLYLALVTLGLAMVTPNLITRFDGITGGAGGINVSGIRAPAWTGLGSDQWIYYVCLAVATVMFLIAHHLVKGRVGRALRAVGTNELTARNLGVNTVMYKSLAFAYSAGFAGVAGGLFTFVIGFVAPESFDLFFAISLVAAMVVGGLGKLSGAVFGALFIVYTPIYAYEVSEALSGVVYGAAIVLIMLLMRDGIAGLLFRARDRLITIQPPSASQIDSAARPIGGPQQNDA